MTTLKIQSEFVSTTALHLTSAAVTVTGRQGDTEAYGLKEPATFTDASTTVTGLINRSRPPAGYTEIGELIKEAEADPAIAERLRVARQKRAMRYSEVKEPTLGDLRRAAGLSQRQLAERCGLEQPNLARYESGGTEPKILIAATMANALGVTLDVFLAAYRQTLEAISKPRKAEL